MDNVGSAVSAVQLSQKLSLPYSLINGSNLRDDVLDQRPIPCSFLGLPLGHSVATLGSQSVVRGTGRFIIRAGLSLVLA